MKNKFSWVLWLVLTVVFAYDVVTVDSVGIKVIRGILVMLCATTCYAEIQKKKNKK